MLEGNSIVVNSSVLVKLSSLAPTVKSAVEPINDFYLIGKGAINVLLEIISTNEFFQESLNSQSSSLLVKVWPELSLSRSQKHGNGNCSFHFKFKSYFYYNV